MAIEDKKIEAKIEEVKQIEQPKQAEETKLPEVGETKVKFLVWFSGALERFEKLQAHHLSVVRAYFHTVGIGEPSTEAAYDEGLRRFGYKGEK